MRGEWAEQLCMALHKHRSSAQRIGTLHPIPEALHPTHDGQELRSGVFGGHSSFAMKSVQLALSQSCV